MNTKQGVTMNILMVALFSIQIVYYSLEVVSRGMKFYKNKRDNIWC